MSDLTALYEKVGRMDGKLDLIVAGLPDHEKRIRALEKRSWFQSGASAVVGFFAATFFRGHS